MVRSSFCFASAVGALCLSRFAVDAEVFDVIAGYTPGSDVVEHSQLDLDMAAMEEGADQEDDAGFAAAWTAYAVGGNSEKSDGIIRTIRGFSTSANEKMGGEELFQVYKAYWEAPDYADIFTTSACNGTDDFEGTEPVVRSEGCLKGAQYQNVWMYVIHELEDAIVDCNNGDLSANDGGPHAWDEGWAFYAGSIEGTSGGSEDGQMIYALADKRCANFGTCTGTTSTSGTSAVNEKMLELYKEGSELLLDGKCDDVIGVKDQIVDLMTVPLVQGVLRYFYLADPDGGNEGDKAASELWAFSAAILPRIDACDEDVAVTIRANTEYSSPSAPVSEGYVVMKEKLESVYSCLGIKCDQVGGLLSDGSSDYYEGFEPCSDSSDGVKGWAVALGVIAAVAVLGGAVFVCVRKRKQKKSAQAMESDLGGFGASKPATTI